MKRIFFFSAALSLFAACSQVEDDNVLWTTDGSLKGTIEQLTIENDTRAAFNDSYSFVWKSKDKIKVLLTSGSSKNYVLSSGANTSDGTFSGSLNAGEVLSNKIAYPNSSTLTSDQISFTLPASYSYGEPIAKGSDASLWLPCWAKIVNNAFTMNYLTGYMMFEIGNIPAGSDCFEFIVTNNKRVNGSFTANLNDAEPMFTAVETTNEDEQKVTITFEPSSSVTTRTFMIPLPAGSYTYEWYMWAGDNLKGFGEQETAITISRGKIKPKRTNCSNIGGGEPSAMSYVVYSTSAESTFGFEMSQNYEATILDKWVKTFCGSMSLSAETLAKEYSLSDIYLKTFQDWSSINNGTKIGTIAWNSDNTALDFSISSGSINPMYVDSKGNALGAMPEADFMVDGFFWFEKKSGDSRIVVPMSISVKEGTFYCQYQTDAWTSVSGDVTQYDINKYISVQSTSSSDTQYGLSNGYKTTRYNYDLRKAFKNNGGTPSTISNIFQYRYADGTVQSSNSAKAPYVETEISFDENRLSDLPSYRSDYIWFVYGNSLYYGVPQKNGSQITGMKSGSEGAVIKSGVISLAEESNTPTEAASLLCGQKVPVKAIASRGISPVVVDHFYVYFEQCLRFSYAAKPVSLTDGEGVVIMLDDVFQLVETRANASRIYFFAQNTINNALKSWYGAEFVEINTANILTNRKPDGTIGQSCSYSLSSIRDSQGNPMYELTADLDTTKGKLTLGFNNYTGNALAQSFAVRIPVVFRSKWTGQIVAYIEANIQ